MDRYRYDRGDMILKLDHEGDLCEYEDYAALEAENAGLRANSSIQEHIIASGSDPKDKEKIVRLIMENAALRADNAALTGAATDYVYAMSDSKAGITVKIDAKRRLTEIINTSNPGDSLLKELEGTKHYLSQIGEALKRAWDEHKPNEPWPDTINNVEWVFNQLQELEALRTVRDAAEEFMSMLDKEFGDCMPDPITWTQEKKLLDALAAVKGE